LDQTETLLRKALAVAPKYYTDQLDSDIAKLEIRLVGVLNSGKKLAEAKSLVEESVNAY
jgi:hypothetical protein